MSSYTIQPTEGSFLFANSETEEVCEGTNGSHSNRTGQQSTGEGGGSPDFGPLFSKHPNGEPGLGRQLGKKPYSSLKEVHTLRVPLHPGCELKE